MVYEVDGDQYIAIAAGGNQGVGSANGDAVWTFSLKGQLNPLWPPPPPPTIAGPASGPIADNVDTVKIGDNNIEFGYFPKRDRIKAGTAVTFTNAGDTPHTATSFDNGKIGNWDTGPLASGESKTITFRQARQLLLHLRAAPVDVRPDYSGVTGNQVRSFGARRSAAARLGRTHLPLCLRGVFAAHKGEVYNDAPAERRTRHETAPLSGKVLIFDRFLSFSVRLVQDHATWRVQRPWSLA